MRYPECSKCYKAIPWIGIGSNGSLFIMKLSVGLFSGSQALIADSLYSLKDVASSAVIWISARISNRGMDSEHPYGHEKVEFFATLVISLFLFLASAYMFAFALDFIFNQTHVAPPHLIALFAAIVSVLVNIFLYKYSRCVAYETNSPLVATASRHHEADAFSSSLVIIAVSAGHFGILILDPPCRVNRIGSSWNPEFFPAQGFKISKIGNAGQADNMDEQLLAVRMIRSPGIPQEKRIFLRNEMIMDVGKQAQNFFSGPFFYPP